MACIADKFHEREYAKLVQTVNNGDRDITKKKTDSKLNDIISLYNN